jgi:hypothetical protein
MNSMTLFMSAPDDLKDPIVTLILQKLPQSANSPGVHPARIGAEPSGLYLAGLWEPDIAERRATDQTGLILHR